LNHVTLIKRPVKVPIDSKTLVQRMRRALRLQGKDLSAVRGRSSRQLIGRSYVVDGRKVIETHVGLKDLALRMNLLLPWEEFVEDDDK
jgi:hypothetical protein